MPLDYYEDGYPKLPACLDRRRIIWRRRLNGPDPGFAVLCVGCEEQVGPNQGRAWQDWCVGGALNFYMGRQWPDAHKQIGGPLRAEPVSRGGPLANAI